MADGVKVSAVVLDPTELVGDASRSREVLGWALTVAFEEIVARMVAADLS